MTRIHLVRHAPTHAKAMVGWTDLPADCSDDAAFARLNDHLPDAVVLSSDLSRAIATADRLTGRPRLPHQPALREINFGAWEMQTFAEIEARDPGLIRAFWDQPGDVTAPEGESWNQLLTRVRGALTTLADTHSGNVIAVSHFGAIVAAIQIAAGLTALQAFSHKIDNLSVTEITITNGQWALIRANARI